MTSDHQDGKKRGHALEKYKHEPGTVGRFSTNHAISEKRVSGVYRDVSEQFLI